MEKLINSLTKNIIKLLTKFFLKFAQMFDVYNVYTSMFSLFRKLKVKKKFSKIHNRSFIELQFRKNKMHLRKYSYYLVNLRENVSIFSYKSLNIPILVSKSSVN